MTFDQFDDLRIAFQQLEDTTNMEANNPSVICGCECGCGGDLFDYDEEEWDWQREQYKLAESMVRNALAAVGVALPGEELDSG